MIPICSCGDDDDGIILSSIQYGLVDGVDDGDAVIAADGDEWKLKSFAAAANSKPLWKDGDFGIPKPAELPDSSIAPTTIASVCDLIDKKLSAGYSKKN